jgi:iron complex transport system substrate-binding protein
MKLQILAKIKYLHERMHIVSMVPSWTETLLEADADVVGRTRFCIHPGQKVAKISILGGTKNWDEAKLRAARPDVILLDREENTAAMGAFQEAPILVTHVRSTRDVALEMGRIAMELKLPDLEGLAERWTSAVSKCQMVRPEDLPGLEWIRRPTGNITKVVYIIWKNPWMAVSRGTFIGSMLSLVVDRSLLFDSKEPYPQIDLGVLDPAATLLLFSSEPYPFGRRREEILGLPFPSALVDGESWSWFGIRSLRFLESIHEI